MGRGECNQSDQQSRGQCRDGRVGDLVMSKGKVLFIVVLNCNKVKSRLPLSSSEPTYQRCKRIP